MDFFSSAFCFCFEGEIIARPPGRPSGKGYKGYPGLPGLFWRPRFSTFGNL